LRLRSRISELESRIDVVGQDRERLTRKSQTYGTQRKTVTWTQEDPQVEVLRRELRGLVSENKNLVEQVRRFRAN
jgi:hypothetical protein